MSGSDSVSETEITADVVAVASSGSDSVRLVEIDFVRVSVSGSDSVSDSLKFVAVLNVILVLDTPVAAFPPPSVAANANV